MPELPEVETLRRGLERGLVGHRIEGVRAPMPQMLKGNVADPDALAQKLQGAQIESVARRGGTDISVINARRLNRPEQKTGLLP